MPSPGLPALPTQALSHSLEAALQRGTHPAAARTRLSETMSSFERRAGCEQGAPVSGGQAGHSAASNSSCGKMRIYWKHMDYL